MSDMLNTILSMSSDNDELKFVDNIWLDYNVLKAMPDRRHEQIRLLYATGLCEPNGGIEHVFMPSIVIKNLEDSILDLYSKVKVQEHSVMLCNEVYFTSKIEGANTTIQRTQQIHNGEFIDYSNAFSEYMIKGAFDATKLLNIRGNKINKEILREVWEVLTYGCCDNKDIDGDMWRIDSIGVGKHTGIHKDLIDEAMSMWIEYYNSSTLKNHPFIKAALLHYAFEFIHPYCDGNGRMGRLLMNNFLIKEGYDKIKAVSFSRSIDKVRLDYDRAFSDSENVYSDCTPFIQFMLSAMYDAFNDVVNN